MLPPVENWKEVPVAPEIKKYAQQQEINRKVKPLLQKDIRIEPEARLANKVFVARKRCVEF